MKPEARKQLEQILRSRTKSIVEEALNDLLEQINEGNKPESMIDWLIETFGDEWGEIEYESVVRQKLKKQIFQPLMDLLTNECVKKHLITE